MWCGTHSQQQHCDSCSISGPHVAEQNGGYLALVEFKDHVCALDPPAESLADVAAKPLTDPLTHQEDKLVTSLVRRKLAHASEDGVFDESKQKSGSIL